MSRGNPSSDRSVADLRPPPGRHRGAPARGEPSDDALVTLRTAMSGIGVHADGCTVPDGPCACGVASARADAHALVDALIASLDRRPTPPQWTDDQTVVAKASSRGHLWPCALFYTGNWDVSRGRPVNGKGCTTPRKCPG